MLDPVRVEDGGNYTCLASNELGHQTSSPVNINTYCQMKNFYKEILTSIVH